MKEKRNYDESVDDIVYSDNYDDGRDTYHEIEIKTEDKQQNTIILKRHGEEKYIDELYGDKFVSISNALIQAREKTSLLESKIELLAIYRMNDSLQVKEKKDADGKNYSVHYVIITAAEMQQLMDRKGESMYNEMSKVALELKKKLYIYRDAGSKEFKIDNLYGEVHYKDGKLSIEFNPSTEYLFREIATNFTKIPLDIAFRFTTNGGFQLYKLLKSYTYTLPPIEPYLSQEDQKALVRHYSLSELRLELGYVDISQPEVKNEGSKPHPDFEKMDALDKKPKYRRTREFFSKVLYKGMAEVNAISDIYIDAIEKSYGAHGKVDGADIRVQNNLKFYKRKYASTEIKQENTASRELTEEQRDAFVDEMREIFGNDIKLSTSDMKKLAELAEYEIKKIENIYSVRMAYNGTIENEMGFLVSAIKNEWKPMTETGSSKQKNISVPRFNQFEQREDYDFDELEKRLIKN